MKECFIVVHRNYAEGLDAYAFWSEDAARKSVRQDVDTEMKSLTEEGYEPTVSWKDDDNVEIKVAGGDIYYEWSVIISSVE